MRIFLIRHGLSQGNQDPEHYITTGDPHIELTDTGWEQAVAAGRFLGDWLRDKPGTATRPPRLWMSSYMRTRQTAAGILLGAGGAISESECKVSSQLIEQDFGIFSRLQGQDKRREKMPLEAEHYYAARQKDKYYARPPQGESPLDVQARRAAPFIGKMIRDRDRGIEDIFIVTHGMTLRALAMEFLKIDPAQYRHFSNPENASIYLIEGDRKNGYSFFQIYNGAEMKPVSIDWGKKLNAGKVILPDVPERFRKGPSP